MPDQNSVHPSFNSAPIAMMPKGHAMSAQPIETISPTSSQKSRRIGPPLALTSLASTDLAARTMTP